MDSISNDFSELSIGDPHPSSQTITTSALRQISAEYDVFTNDDHAPLDEMVSETFSLYQVFKVEPSMHSLLSNLTMHDARLVNLTPPQAQNLLEREPSITGVLKAAWRLGSFKSVRQLGVFPIFCLSIFQLIINQKSCGQTGVVVAPISRIPGRRFNIMLL